MKTLKNYSLNEVTYKQVPYVFYKASRDDTAESFIIKTMTLSNDATHSYYSNLLHEFALLQKLSTQSDHTGKIIEFTENDEFAGIVYQDNNFIPLSSLCSDQSIDINLFFIIAIQTVNGLIEIHKNNIIHKNISLDSIYFSPEQESIQIHDFSIASQLKPTLVANEVVNLLQGNLAYIAPEQTGRINRPLTQRADLYSLGVSFYHLLTGHPPFTKQNSNELIFDLIATPPIPPHEINPAIPQQLSLIVLKLLSKMAEDRYKSALGLHADLERAWIEFKDKQTISLFPLAKDDIAIRLELPDKLYGRDKEIKMLNDTFDSFYNTGENSLLIVSGYSGTGKTSLIHELIEKVTRKSGLFVDGKFDKFERSDSYAALRIALNKMVTYQLSLPEQERAQFKIDLETELSNVLDVITEFIPKLQEIVGRMEKPLDIGFERTKNRFEMAIQRFINIVSKNCPLIIFLDDLQWANYSLFDLLSKILLSKQINHVLLVMSYRSNEVSKDSPIMKFIDSVSIHKSPQTISIQGLDSSAVVDLLHDMLYIREESIQPLAELLYRKTEGNPFFLLMLLEELYKEGKIIFSEQRNTWSWQEEDIASFAASDNVVEFVNQRLAKLPTDCKLILECAACIGNNFSLEELSFPRQKTARELVEALQPALQAGLIVPSKISYEWFEGVSENNLMHYEYYFQHDRIQQSCYHLLTSEEAKMQHLTIARNWCCQYDYKSDPIRTMLIAEQFNKGLVYVTDEKEKELIRNLNCQSGKIAMESIAYEMAYHYDSFTISLLPINFHETDYSTWFDVYHHYIKSSFLSYHFKESEQICEYVLSIIKDNFDKAKILFLKGDLTRTIGDKNSISYFEKGLSIIGYSDIAKKPSKFDILQKIVLFKYYLRKHNLDILPTDIDEKQYFTYSMALHLAQECYFSGDILRWAYIFLTWGVRTFPYHNKELRSLYIGINAVIWPHSDPSYRLFEKCIPIFIETSRKELAVSFYLAYSALNLAWHTPLMRCIDNFKKAAEMSEQCGDLEFCATSYLTCITCATNKDLTSLNKEISLIKKRVSDISFRTFLNTVLYENFYRTLSGESLDSSNQSVDTIVDYFTKENYTLGLYVLHVTAAGAMFHLEEFSQLSVEKVYLYENVEMVNKSNNTIIAPFFHLYLFLTLTELYPKENFIGKIKFRLQLIRIMHRVTLWSKHCPDNFLPLLMLLRGEWARINNRFTTALNHFDTAANLADKYALLELTALSYHRALLLCVQKKNSEKISFYLQKTIRAYEKWGAFNVVSILKNKYGHSE